MVCFILYLIWECSRVGVSDLIGLTTVLSSILSFMIFTVFRHGQLKQIRKWSAWRITQGKINKNSKKQRSMEMSQGRIVKTSFRIYSKINSKWNWKHSIPAQKSRKKNKKIDKNRSRHIVTQFLLYKDKRNLLKNCKKLKNTRFSIFEDFSRETVAIRKEK